MSSLAVLALAALAFPGCAGLPFSSPAPLDTYELSAPAPDSARRRRGVQLLVAEPSALKALDGEKIVVKPAPGEIQFLKGAQWADRLPKVIQARLAEAFQASGSFGGVGKPGEGLAIDYQVVTDIRAFEIRAGGGARAHVELFVRLLNDRNGVVRSARVFEAAAPVVGSDNAAYVAALDAAFRKVATDIVLWAASSI